MQTGFLNFNWFLNYGGRESCNLRKHMPIEKAPVNYEHIHQFDSSCTANTHNTTKYRNVLYIQLKQIQKRVASSTDHNGTLTKINHGFTTNNPPPKKYKKYMVTYS